MLSWMLFALAGPGCSGAVADLIEGDEPGECSDALDNDKDGDTDCDDAGCSSAPECGGSPPDTGTATDTGTGIPSDTNTPTDTDIQTDTDTGGDSATPAVRKGTLSYAGTATVSTEYVGSEEIVFVDNNDDTLLCHITVDLTSNAERTDCEDCDWAYDLTSSNATVLVDEGPCLALTGFDATTISDLDGQAFSYGYDPDFIGHAKVLRIYDGIEWSVVAYATWDDAAQAFAYDWHAGTYSY